MIAARLPRLLALDLGTRRTGVAISDDLGAFAHPRPALHHRSPEALLDAVASLVAAEEVDEVVVGLPLALSGAETEQTRESARLIGLLQARLSVPVTTWDERLSSVEAARGARPADRKSGAIDSAAAAIVLQAVLDSRRSRDS